MLTFQSIPSDSQLALFQALRLSTTKSILKAFKLKLLIMTNHAPNIATQHAKTKVKSTSKNEKILKKIRGIHVKIKPS
jgi:hypothetical protein